MLQHQEAGGLFEAQAPCRAGVLRTRGRWRRGDEGDFKATRSETGVILLRARGSGEEGGEEGRGGRECRLPTTSGHDNKDPSRSIFL